MTKEHPAARRRRIEAEQERESLLDQAVRAMRTGRIAPAALDPRPTDDARPDKPPKSAT